MIDRDQMEAIIYARVSDTKQKTDGNGLLSQATRCQEYADSRGYKVIEIFEDDETGKVAKRKGSDEMLRFLRKRRGKPIVVIFEHINRVARDVITHATLRREITDCGATIEYPSIRITNDASGRMQEGMLVVASQYHRESNAEQTLSRMRARAQNGYYVGPKTVGYNYVSKKFEGRVLQLDPVTAPVVREALEGYASGRFERQTDVRHWLQAHPLFPKGKQGRVWGNQVERMLRQPLYAGFINVPRWNIHMQPGKHEPIISAKTFQRIQDRLRGIDRAPVRKNIEGSFPLRGYVHCTCGTPLTACWSTGRSKQYPYYLCPKKGCEHYGRSVRKEIIEGQFEELLHEMQPSEKLIELITAVFRRCWDLRSSQAVDESKALKRELATVEKQIDQYLDRIVETSTPSVVRAFEQRVQKLETDKAAIKERIAQCGRPAHSFDDTLRTALAFVSRPWNLWASGDLESQKTVLKLTFADRLQYARGEGFRTASLTLPFKVLAGLKSGNVKMARGLGPTMTCSP